MAPRRNHRRLEQCHPGASKKPSNPRRPPTNRPIRWHTTTNHQQPNEQPHSHKQPQLRPQHKQHPPVLQIQFSLNGQLSTGTKSTLLAALPDDVRNALVGTLRGDLGWSYIWIWIWILSWVLRRRVGEGKFRGRSLAYVLWTVSSEVDSENEIKGLVSVWYFDCCKSVLAGERLGPRGWMQWRWVLVRLQKRRRGFPRLEIWAAGFAGRVWGFDPWLVLFLAAFGYADLGTHGVVQLSMGRSLFWWSALSKCLHRASRDEREASLLISVEVAFGKITFLSDSSLDIPSAVYHSARQIISKQRTIFRVVFQNKSSQYGKMCIGAMKPWNIQSHRLVAYHDFPKPKTSPLIPAWTSGPAGLLQSLYLEGTIIAVKLK